MNQIAVRDERTLAIEDKINKQVSSAILVGAGGISFQNAGEVMEFAKMMAVSGSAVPKHLRGQPGACLGIIDDAIRFQMSPYALARKSYFVNDNLAYEAQVIAGIINAFAPLKERPNVEYAGEGADRKCIITFNFKDGAVRTYESPKFKDIHPKNSPLWKTDPDQQQAYYSLRACARRHCSEVILGIYDVEEIRAIEHHEQEVRPSLTDRLSAARASQGEAAQAREGFDADFVRSETAALSGEAEIEQETSASPSAGEGSDGTPDLQTPPVAAGPSASSVPNPDDAPEAGDIEAQAEPDASPASEPDMVNSAKAMATEALKAEMVKKLLQLAGDNDLTVQERLETLDGMKPVWVDKMPGFPGVVSQVFATAAKIVKGELKPDAGRKFMENLL